MHSQAYNKGRVWLTNRAYINMGKSDVTKLNNQYLTRAYTTFNAFISRVGKDPRWMRNRLSGHLPGVCGDSDDMRLLLGYK